MTGRLVVTFVMLALAVACAQAYFVTFIQPSVIAGRELEAATTSSGWRAANRRFGALRPLSWLYFRPRMRAVRRCRKCQ